MANTETLNHDGIDRYVMFFIIKITTCWLFFMTRNKNSARDRLNTERFGIWVMYQVQ